MEKTISFRPDSELAPLLQKIPYRERTAVIRQALRAWFFGHTQLVPSTQIVIPDTFQAQEKEFTLGDWG